MRTFVVTAFHDTGHGQVGTPILVTHDIVQAIEAALGAENFGYEFHGETYVSVSQLEPGRLYTKADHAAGRTAVFCRIRYRGSWMEPRWSDPLLQRLYEQAVETRLLLSNNAD